MHLSQYVFHVAHSYGLTSTNSQDVGDVEYKILYWRLNSFTSSSLSLFMANTWEKKFTTRWTNKWKKKKNNSCKVTGNRFLNRVFDSWIITILFNSLAQNVFLCEIALLTHHRTRIRRISSRSFPNKRKQWGGTRGNTMIRPYCVMILIHCSFSSAICLL